jgi:hypothetical protein
MAHSYKRNTPTESATAPPIQAVVGPKPVGSYAIQLHYHEDRMCCPHCPKCFDTKTTLIEHLHQATLKQFLEKRSCLIKDCPYEFRSNQSRELGFVLIHYMQHIPSVECDGCEQLLGFNSPDTLRVHQKVHLTDQSVLGFAAKLTATVGQPQKSGATGNSHRACSGPCQYAPAIQASSHCVHPGHYRSPLIDVSPNTTLPASTRVSFQYNMMRKAPSAIKTVSIASESQTSPLATQRARVEDCPRPPSV